MEKTQVNDETNAAADDVVEQHLAAKKPASSGRGIAMLALLLALAASGWSAWQWWQQRTAGPVVQVQHEAIQKLQLAQQDFTSALAAYETRLSAAGTPVDPLEFSRLGERFKVFQTQLETARSVTAEQQATVGTLQGATRSLEQRASVLESGLITLAARSQNSSAELDLAEIDFLLRTASERLQLFADPEAAELALQAADVQIEALNDPMFLSVRQGIAVARQALATVPRVDHLQLSAQLSAMQTEIPALPFYGEVAPLPESELPVDAGWWQSLKQTLSSLVTVRRQVADGPPLLSLDDKDYLRQGLWLQLESARLALMRSDAGAYTSSLARVSATVTQFFQPGSASVEALAVQLTQLRQVNIAAEMPDISASWRQLRQLRDSRRLLNSATPLEAVDGS